jgi:hypothetical protein
MATSKDFVKDIPTQDPPETFQAIHTDPENINITFTERVGVKIPPISNCKIENWFRRVERQFEIAGIKSDETKCNHIIANLDSDSFDKLPDSATEGNDYAFLKKTMIERLGISPEDRRTTLFRGIELGDKKPSALLHEIEKLATGLELSQSNIKHLWVQQLPSDIQKHLIRDNSSLDSLASFADTLLTIDQRKEVAELEHRPSTSNTLDATISKLLDEKLNVIVKALGSSNNDQVRYDNKPKHFPNRSNYNNRHNHFSNRNQYKSNYQANANNPRSDLATNTNKFAKNQQHADYCYYHSTFGEKAQKCKPPCSYKSPKAQKN